MQKSVLNCLYAYNFNYLTPYKEHLNNLLIGKHFRNEIIVFSLDEQHGVLAQEHRSDFLKILMRILYGKFHSNETTHTSSKDTMSNKRSTIIQFISSCTENEIKDFLNLIFGVLIKEKSENKNSDLVDLKNVVPLKKMSGILQTMDIILNKLGKQIYTYSHDLFDMLCFVSKYVSQLFNTENDRIEDGKMNTIKLIHRLVSVRFKQFFDIYDDLDYTQEELFNVFDNYIWLNIEKIRNECLVAPSNLLKLFHLWSERSRFYPLFICKSSNFVKSTSKPITKCILDYVFELIDSKKCSQQIIDFIMSMIHNFVTYCDFKTDGNDVDMNISSLPIDVKIDTAFDQVLTSELNYGTLMLRPYSTSIISHIESIVTQNMTKKQLPPKPLKILARISCFASNSKEQCEKIILLFIPYLIKNRKQENEENEINILNSINYLLNQVNNVMDFINPLSRLFSIIKARNARIQLCLIFKTIKELCPQFGIISDICIDLNAWDPKHLEEPDYIVRMDAFKRLNRIIQELDQFNDRIGLLLIYNCSFFLHNIEDFAIKEASLHCLIEFMKKSVSLKLKESDKYCIESSLLPEIKSGLKSKSENVRHEFVNILLQFTRIYQNLYPRYKDLLVLNDTEDIEVDFYENIRHIQMHRRARALKKLQKACLDKLISKENLLSFMMPLIKSFLENEVYLKYDYLIEEACITVGSVCSCLPWAPYKRILDLNLKHLQKNTDNQNINIKIIINVLDSFHYDLNSCDTQEAVHMDETIEEIEEDNDDENDKEMAFEDNDKKLNQVSKENATKIHFYLTKNVLPLLFKFLTKKMKKDEEHKSNTKKSIDEDEKILRVPIALAILKLLKSLPKRSLEIHLPGLLLRICEMLKSRAISVRNSVRECLIKIVNSLDKQYYYYIFKELSNSLTRGYQIHVLCYTIQMLLKYIQPRLENGDLDSSVSIFSHVFTQELFSDVGDEKEVKQIVAKVFEAKHTSSFNSFEIVAKYITPSYLVELIKPLNQQLEICKSKKVIKKIEEAFRRIDVGLLENKSFKAKEFILFIYGLINESFNSLTNVKKRFEERKKQITYENEGEKQPMSSLRPQNCLLIPKEPVRGGEKPLVQPKTNHHIITEFALLLFNHLLKQNQIQSNDQEHVQMIDPMMSHFVDYLDGKHVKLTTNALRCLSSLISFKLPSMQSFSQSLTQKMFNLLQMYGYSTESGSKLNSGGENFELLIACFKAISIMIRDYEHFKISDENLKILLHYAERNLYESSRQASAFNLLKSIFTRKLQCEEIKDVVSKLMKLSIQSESPNIRLQARQAVLQYLINYPLGEKNIPRYLEFYVMQLNYEYEDGRESALEMLETIFTTFPIKTLNENAAFFFIPLAIQLNNDESSKCKKLCSLAIKSLLEKISIEQKDSLYEMTKAWFDDDDKPLHKRIAALLIKIFVDVEKTQFERRLNDLIPLFEKQLNHENFFELSEIDSERLLDQYLVNMLNLLIKIINECKLLNFQGWKTQINRFFNEILYFLTYEHQWVQLASAQLFGLLFSSCPVDDFIQDKLSFMNYDCDPSFKIENLVDKFCDQLKSQQLNDSLAEQIVKNLIYMAKVVRRTTYTKNDQVKHDINLTWLIKKVLKEAKYELVNQNKQFIKRSYIFKWLAAVANDLGKDDIKQYLDLIIPPIQRELVIPDTDEKLKILAKEVLDFLKQLVGMDDFGDIYSKVVKQRNENRIERKRKAAQQHVLEPHLAAMKKIKKMQKKKDDKKRKRVLKNSDGKKTFKRSKVDTNYIGNE